jgi:hypothetical protein
MAAILKFKMAAMKTFVQMQTLVFEIDTLKAFRKYIVLQIPKNSERKKYFLHCDPDYYLNVVFYWRVYNYILL